jgi:hypothetical protein
MLKSGTKLLLKSIIGGVLLFNLSALYALPFTIVPKSGTTLPTTVTTGSTVSAFYTVINNTGSTRNNNYVKYLPPNTTQVTAGGVYGDTCGSTFNLTANGNTGDSCTLQLTVSGAVNANDPDPHHHLFVCFPGGTTCAGTNYPLNVTAVAPPPVTAPLAIAAGVYTAATGTEPLLAHNNDNGVSWLYATVHPSDYVNGGSLSGSDCNGSVCLVAGRYVNSGGTISPLLGISTDDATTWTFPASITSPATLPINFNSGAFNTVHCFGSLCLAGGNYTNTTALTRPLLARSNDGGNTWTYPTTIQSNLPGTFSNQGNIFGTGCSGTFCIAAGSYQTAMLVTTPLLTQSTDNGVTWNYISDVPSDYSGNGVFNDAACSSSHCMAVGRYTSNAIGNPQKPMLAVTANGGASWSYVALLPGDFGNLGTYSGISCSGNICIAAGSYFIAGITKTLLSITTDGGATWSLVAQVLPSDFQSGQYFGASCSGNTCIAVGRYRTTGAANFPLIEQSTDGGVTWSAPSTVVSNLPALPGGSVPFFENASCLSASQFCIAAGSYGNVANVKPLLAVTSDNGATWTYPDSAFSVLPSDFVNLGSYASSSVSAGP